ncbi:MAG: hypothetical protein Q4D62_09925 [Planctomycetia bacterium]|nr:hypothetical protein [Planctomycetia bacterium]
MSDSKHHRLSVHCQRSGYTLVEILMATALALLLLVSVIRIFMMMSDGFAESRTLLEMLGRIRNAQRLLESDLSHYTVTMRPPRPIEADDGYFACGETEKLGIDSQSDKKVKRGDIYLVNQNILDQSSCKDYVSLTVFNKEAPFRYIKNQTITSGNSETLETPYAEVLWFVKEYDLYRIVVPVVPDNGDTGDGANFSTRYHRINLGELGSPENRITHADRFNQFDLSNYMILPNVIHFEVQLWSPSDNEYITLEELKTKSKGKYFRDSEEGTESSATDQKSLYDTWSTSMLASSQNGGELTSTSSTGDGSVAIVTGIFTDNSESEVSESEKFPPSTAFLPGVRIVVRAFDPSSGQVREFRVAQDFRTR